MKPLTREEIFKKAIAEGKEAPIKPITREEHLMAEHAKREASGGGSGGGLTTFYVYDDYYVYHNRNGALGRYENDRVSVEEVEEAAAGGVIVLAYASTAVGISCYTYPTRIDWSNGGYATFYIGSDAYVYSKEFTGGPV